MREEAQAQVLEDALANPAGEVGLEVGGPPVHERGGDERGDDPIERGEVAGHDPVVDREFREVGRREARGRAQHERHEREDRPPPVGTQKLGDALKPPQALASRAPRRRP